ncbi:hypothetical protein H9655_18615 [Cytobacillus sp. Sa5YUA1]|uniref:Uncharacterized protein n=1 Tax=Cytobacillus stercorigallinarum TaxID=2762240 RepID=A0ABR8QU42_9BACI|nr:hypothetical protein [Cytobacillus stercorigallinarum]MBD7939054.1 hypothetical protein [Cytobacillus stercorigallinarum]
MGEVRVDYTGWEYYDQLIKQYGEQNEDYYIYFYGYKSVYVDEIKGLSYEGVLRQKKLDRLYQSIKKYGYLCERYRDLHLIYLPNKTYTVATGGNHRPYLAKLLEIKKIIGMVEILIPKNLLADEQILECEKILDEEGIDVHTRNPYFYKLCEEYDLLPPKMKIRISKKE